MNLSSTIGTTSMMNDNVQNIANNTSQRDQNIQNRLSGTTIGRYLQFTIEKIYHQRIISCLVICIS